MENKKTLYEFKTSPRFALIVGTVPAFAIFSVRFFQGIAFESNTLIECAMIFVAGSLFLWAKGIRTHKEEPS